MSDTENTGKPAEENTGRTAEENGEQPGEQQTPTVEDLQAQIEKITAESRKWESRSKENYEKAQKYDEAERARMSAEERLNADLEEASTRAAEAEERAQTAEAELARYKVAVEFSLSDEDATALEGITDEKQLRALAERLSERSTGPRPHRSQGRRHGSASGPASTGDLFAQTLDGLF